MVENEASSVIQSSVPPEDLLQLPAQNCYRLVILGSARVGKSSIVNRFLNNKFTDSYTPTIENFHRKVYRIKGEIHQLDILDTSGNHPFPAMRRLSFITGDLFILVFSVDSRESFEEALRLRDQIIETKLHMAGGYVSGGSGTTGGSSSNSGSKKAPQVPVNIILAGNKCDKDMRTVTSEEAQLLCCSTTVCSMVETSAKKNHNVDELFRILFQSAGLPPEMAPNCHRRIFPGQPVAVLDGPPTPQRGQSSSRRFQGFSKLSLRRRLSDAYGVVAPNVRRPSLRTDLLIMRNKTGNAGAASRVSSPRSTSCHGTTCVIQ